MIGSMVALFSFTVRQALQVRKILPTALLMLSPSVLILVIGHFNPDGEDWNRFHRPMHFVLVTIVLPLACLLHGSSLIGSEIEGRTLDYLLTRKLRRAPVLIVRFMAMATVVIVLVELAAIVAYASAFMTVGADVLSDAGRHMATDWSPSTDLMSYLLVLPVGAVAFLSVFTLIGLIPIRPLAVAMTYFVVGELILSNIPVQMQVYTIGHHLRAALFAAIPQLRVIYEYPPDMMVRLYPPEASGVVPLLVVTVLAVGLSCLLMTLRELTPAKIARD